MIISKSSKKVVLLVVAAIAVVANANYIRRPRDKALHRRWWWFNDSPVITESPVTDQVQDVQDQLEVDQVQDQTSQDQVIDAIVQNAPLQEQDGQQVEVVPQQASIHQEAQQASLQQQSPRINPGDLTRPLQRPQYSLRELSDAKRSKRWFWDNSREDLSDELERQHLQNYGGNRLIGGRNRLTSGRRQSVGGLFYDSPEYYSNEFYSNELYDRSDELQRQFLQNGGINILTSGRRQPVGGLFYDSPEYYSNELYSNELYDRSDELWRQIYGRPAQGGHGVINPVIPAQGGHGVVNPGRPTQGGHGAVNPGRPAQGGHGAVNQLRPAQGGHGAVNPLRPAQGGHGVDQGLGRPTQERIPGGGQVRPNTAAPTQGVPDQEVQFVASTARPISIGQHHSAYVPPNK